MNKKNMREHVSPLLKLMQQISMHILCQNASCFASTLAIIWK